MEMIYHPLVKRDVIEIGGYYAGVSPRLSAEFHDELQKVLQKVAGNPLRFSLAGYGFRRANLRRFPYHVLYEVQENRIRVMLVRHHKRHPQFGLERS